MNCNTVNSATIPYGPQGPSGINGTNGTNGTNFLTGTTNPPSSTLGNVGDNYLCSTDTTLWTKTASGWLQTGTLAIVKPANLRGYIGAVANGNNSYTLAATATGGSGAGYTYYWVVQSFINNVNNGPYIASGQTSKVCTVNLPYRTNVINPIANTPNITTNPLYPSMCVLTIQCIVGDSLGNLACLYYTINN